VLQVTVWSYNVVRWLTVWSSLCCAETWEVVFALDDSSNVQQSEWSAMLTFINSYIDQVVIGFGNIRISVVRYSSTRSTSVAFGLNEYRSAGELKTAISRLGHFSQSSERNLAEAFRITLWQILPETQQRYFASKVTISY